MPLADSPFISPRLSPDKSTPNPRWVIAALSRRIQTMGLNGPRCIGMTRAATLVCRAFGITARPMEVGILCANSAMLRHYGWPAVLPLSASEQPTMNSAGFGPTGHYHPPGFFCGHVVAFVDRQYLVDLAVAQFRMPGRGVVTPPTLAASIPQFEDGEDNVLVSTHYEAHRATAIIYTPRPLSREVKRATDWRSQDYRILAKMLVEDMRREFAQDKDVPDMILPDECEEQPDNPHFEFKRYLAGLYLDDTWAQYAREGKDAWRGHPGGESGGPRLIAGTG